MTVHCASCRRRLRSDEPRYRLTIVTTYVQANHGKSAAWFCDSCGNQVIRTTKALGRATQEADPMYRRRGNRDRQLSLLASPRRGERDEQWSRGETGAAS